MLPNFCQMCNEIGNYSKYKCTASDGFAWEISLGELGSRAIPVTQPRLRRQQEAIVKLSAWELPIIWWTAWGEDYRQATPGSQLVSRAAGKQPSNGWGQPEEHNTKQSLAEEAANRPLSQKQVIIRAVGMKGIVPERTFQSLTFLIPLLKFNTGTTDS